MASSYLCSQCTEKSIQSYLFIYNAKQLSKIVYKSVNELLSKAIDVNNELKVIDNYENSNIVIVLDQNDEMSDYIDIGKMTEIVAKETPKDEELKPVLTEINKLAIESATNIEPKSNSIEEVNIENLQIIEDCCVVSDQHQEIEITYLEESPKSPKDEKCPQTPLCDNLESKQSGLKKRKAKIKRISFDCPRCKGVIPNYKSWKEHYRICKKKKIDPNKMYTCKICPDSQQFISLRSLNSHYKTHAKTRCKVCQFIVSEADLIEHMKINHEDYVHLCKLCNYFSYSADGLQTHTEKFHSGPQCALCHKKVKENDLKFHRCKFNCLECTDNVCKHYKYLVSYRDQFINNAVKIKCPDCDYVCPRREALLGHANREHLDHHPFICAHCDQQFYSRTTLRCHINQFHKERYICEFCDQEYYTKTSLENHRKLCQCIERDFKCDHCTCSFDTLEELANHVKLRHDEDTFNCNLCKKKFLSKIKLQDHIFKVHSGLQIKRKRSLLECPVCETKCLNRRQLMQHIKDHPNSRFPCKECNEDFDCIRKLHAHIRKHYDDVIECVDCKKVLTKTFYPHHLAYCNKGRPTENVFTCETCGRSYSSEVQLKFHRKVHLDKVPCPVCQKPTRPVYMKGHMKHCNPKKYKMHQEAKPKQKYVKCIKCDWCNHMMSRYNELEAHVNRFHLKVKPYQCNYCKKSFFGKERLKGHLVTHTSIKACYCSVCNKQFQNNACLKLHMRRHTGYTPYACDVCGERFRTSSIMNTHKVKKHSERTVACPLCDSMFHLTREMRFHFKKVHWKQKGKKFDPRDVKELSPAFYHLFEDGRLPKVEGEDLYISSKFNEKFD